MKDSSQFSTVNSQLPKGWELKKLSELFDVKSSKRVHKADWKEDGIPFYRAREVVKLAQHGFVNNLLFISPELYDKYTKEKGAPKENDIIISAVGTLGKCYLVRKDDKFYIKDASVLWFENISNINSRYIDYAFKSDLILNQVMNKSMGATVGTLTISRAKLIEIPIPPLSEQQRIVEILDKAFVAIDKAKQNAEQNLRNAKAVFQSKLQGIFDNGKLKVENGEWEEKRLKEVCEITSKLIDPKENQYQDMIHVGAGNIVAENGALIDLKTAREEELISGKFVFDKSMVLYSKIRPYLMKIVKCDFKGLCSADIYPLTPIKDKITKSFLYYLLFSSEFTRYAIEGSQRAGMPKVNRSHLFNYSFYCPSLTEQEQLAQSLDKLSAEIDILEAIYQQKLVNLTELKKSILQKAFRGEL